MKITKNDTVLFLPAWYPNRVDKQGGNFVQNHATALNKFLNVHILYICPQPDLPTLFEFTKTNDKLNTYILYYKEPRRKDWLVKIYEGFLYGIGTIYAYGKYRKTNGAPALFHVHVLTRTCMLPLLLSFFGARYVITEHWSRYLKESNTYHGFLRKWLTKLSVKRSKGLSTVSDIMFNALASHKLKHHHQTKISNVVRNEFWEAEIIDKDYNNQFIYITSFDEKSKNSKGILEACKILENKGVEYTLQIIGEGIGQQQIIEYVEYLTLKNIKFIPYLPTQDLVKVYQKANALILFSNYESQSQVILEALSFGLPVIATRAGAIPELIDEKNGILVEPKDVEDLSDKMIRFIKGNYFFNAQSIRKQAKTKYSSDAVVRQFLSFYDGIYV